MLREREEQNENKKTSADEDLDEIQDGDASPKQRGCGG
jgi:hypothetical protein